MAYDVALMKELKKQWPKVGRKGGYFALAMNNFPRDQDAQPLLRVHANKVMTKAALKKVGPDGNLPYAKTITGRIDVGGEVSFWIAGDSVVKSPALLRKAIKRLAEDAEIALLQPKFASLRRAPMAVEEEVEIDQAELVDTEEARRAGGKSKLKKTLGVGDYAKLLKRLDTWKKNFHAKGVTSSSAPKARQALWAIHEDAQAWINAHQGTTQIDRLAAVQQIMTTCAALRAKLDQRLALLAESASVDALLEGDRPLTDAEERMAARNLHARLENTQDEDEREQIVLALKGLPHAVALDMEAARQTEEQAELEDRELTREEAAVRVETQQRAGRVLALYALGARATPLVDPRGGDTRITGRDAARVALVEHVDDMLQLPPDVHSEVISSQASELKGLLESLETMAPDLAAVVEGKLREAGVEASIDVALTALDKVDGDVEQALKTLGRGNNLGSKLLGIIRQRATEELADQTRLATRQLLGDDLLFSAVEPERYEEDGKAFSRYPDPFVAEITRGVEAVADRFLNPYNLPHEVLVLAGQMYDGIAEQVHPRIARQMLLDGILLRTIVPMLTFRLKNPKTGDERVPQAFTMVSAFVQNIFNKTTSHDSPQFNDLIRSFWPRVDAFWVRLIQAGYEAAGIGRAPLLDDETEAQQTIGRWLDLRDRLTDSALSSDPALQQFITKKPMGRHPVTGKADADLRACQAEAAAFLATFDKARADLARIDLAAAFAQDPASTRQRWDREWFPMINDPVGMNGLQNAVAMWHNRIIQLTHTLEEARQRAWDESREHDVWKAAQIAVGEENGRQGEIERDINEQVFGDEVWRQD